jgi:hypothetical protein
VKFQRGIIRQFRRMLQLPLLLRLRLKAESNPNITSLGMVEPLQTRVMQREPQDPYRELANMGWFPQRLLLHTRLPRKFLVKIPMVQPPFLQVTPQRTVLSPEFHSMLLVHSPNLSSKSHL